MIAHLLRQRARRLVLQKVSADRNDREGLDCIDLEATSHKILSNGHSRCPPEKLPLSAFGGLALSGPPQEGAAAVMLV